MAAGLSRGSRKADTAVVRPRMPGHLVADDIDCPLAGEGDEPYRRLHDGRQLELRERWNSELIAKDSRDVLLAVRKSINQEPRPPLGRFVAAAISPQNSDVRGARGERRVRRTEWANAIRRFR